jgi:flagellar protein FlaG
MIDDLIKTGLPSPVKKALNVSEMDELYKEKPTKQEAPVEAKEPLKKEIEDSVQRVNQSLKVVNTALEISLDKEINDKVVRVVNTQSGEVIRQFPSKEFLAWEKEYARLLGLLFDKKV